MASTDSTRLDPRQPAATRQPQTVGRRRRRPTGAPPPLPRHIGWSTWTRAAVLLVVVAWTLAVGKWEAVRRATEQFDAAILRPIAERRNDAVTDVARAVDAVASGWAMFVVALGLLAALVVLRRWRHLFAFLGSVLALQILGLWLIDTVHRPRPFDVTQIGDWQGFSLPSAPAAIVSFTVVGIVFTMVVPGRPRSTAKAIGVGVVGVVAASRLYLGVDHPTDIVAGVVIGAAIPLVAFRFFVPNELFPVSYHRRKTAHLDIDERRAEAIRRAVQDQLGLTVIGIAPIGLAGSGGSTPLRLGLADGRSVFGKLYAMNHVRADRWYKMGRTVLYGRLEDEAPFRSVRRLVQQEDYTLRVMRDAGVPTAAPLGVVELTPEREYLFVTEFVDGAVEIGEAEVDEGVIDEGLLIVRRLWDAGLAHRDIKPANLLVREGRVVLIDVAFAQLRPSPWREAVDLANMMLVLAVRSEPAVVYARALAFFTPDDIAEAFAAARGIASPSQLRAAMRDDGRDLIRQFRALAPHREPISLQRWSLRRIGLVVAIVVIGGLTLQTVVSMFTPADLSVSGQPNCGTGDVMVLMAQAVPTATSVPCLESTPAGWDLGGVRVEEDHGSFWLDVDDVGRRAVEVAIRPSCTGDLGEAEVSDIAGTRRYVRQPATPDGSTVRSYVSTGACVTYRVAPAIASDVASMARLDVALGMQPRRELVEPAFGRRPN